MSPAATTCQAPPILDAAAGLFIGPGAVLPRDTIDRLSLEQLAAFMRLCRRFGVSRIVDRDTHYELEA